MEVDKNATDENLENDAGAESAAPEVEAEDSADEEQIQAEPESAPAEQSEEAAFALGVDGPIDRW